MWLRELSPSLESLSDKLQAWKAGSNQCQTYIHSQDMWASYWSSVKVILPTGFEPCWKEVGSTMKGRRRFLNQALKSTRRCPQPAPRLQTQNSQKAKYSDYTLRLRFTCTTTRNIWFWSFLHFCSHMLLPRISHLSFHQNHVYRPQCFKTSQKMTLQKTGCFLPQFSIVLQLNLSTTMATHHIFMSQPRFCLSNSLQSKNRHTLGSKGI